MPSTGIKKDDYFYDSQIRRYILQFMAVFAGLQVKFGKNSSYDEQMVTVPIFYGDQDRVVAAIQAGNTQNTPIRVPCMSAKLRSLQLDMSQAHGVGTTRRTTYVPSGGLVPDDVRVVYQPMPVPYNMNLDLSMYASNNDQLYQMLEQILILFDPSLQLQLSDNVMDWTAIKTISLDNISFEDNYPSGRDTRLLQVTLSFTTTAHIAAPADIKKNFVEKIFARIGVVTANTDMSDSYDIIHQLDEQGAEYEQIWQLDTTKFQ